MTPRRRRIDTPALDAMLAEAQAYVGRHYKHHADGGPSGEEEFWHETLDAVVPPALEDPADAQRLFAAVLELGQLASCARRKDDHPHDPAPMARVAFSMADDRLGEFRERVEGDGPPFGSDGDELHEAYAVHRDVVCNWLVNVKDGLMWLTSEWVKLRHELRQCAYCGADATRAVDEGTMLLCDDHFKEEAKVRAEGRARRELEGRAEVGDGEMYEVPLDEVKDWTW